MNHPATGICLLLALPISAIISLYQTQHASTLTQLLITYCALVMYGERLPPGQLPSRVSNLL